MTQFCIDNYGNRDVPNFGDLGCLNVPFGSITLRHIIEQAERLVDDSVRHLVISTDDEPWLRQQIRQLAVSHPQWRVVYVAAPRRPEDIKKRFPGEPWRDEYLYTRYMGGTESGVLLYSSWQLTQQCEAFVGYTLSMMSNLMYHLMCIAHNGTEGVCPPAYDMKLYKPLQTGLLPK